VDGKTPADLNAHHGRAMKGNVPMQMLINTSMLALALCVTSQPGSATEPPAFSGFSWVRDGQLAGMPKPGAQTGLDQDLAFLNAQNVQVLISLTETPTPEDKADTYGIELIHIPVKDFTAPTQQQLLDFITIAQASLDAGKPVGVHCLGGHGRTGTFLAAWFIHEGMGAEEALVEIRELRPESVETKSQEKALYALESYIHSTQKK